VHRSTVGSGASTLGQVLVAVLAFAVPATAADVTNPAEVENLRASLSGNDILLEWDSVTTDAAGNPEAVDYYEIYRGLTPDFVPDKAGASNRIGTSTSEGFLDAGVASDGQLYHYLINAVDLDGNQGVTRPPRIDTPPALSGFWTETTIELDWTDALPLDEVVNYRIYRGRAAGVYEFVEDVGLLQVYSATGLETNVNWHFAVTAIDSGGNEATFSNEHVDPVAGTVTLRVHDDSALCWGASGCTPSDPEHVQRSDGFQLLVPSDFPEGEWTRVEVTFTMESRLCTPPAGENTTKCGSGNPCLFPPCNGGWNTCGDPWDRLAHLFLVLDDCVEQGHACMNHDNLELMRAVTPFGTDAPPPDGTGFVPPRELTLDITPFANLLSGRRHIGAHIGHFTQQGWWVTSDFHFSKRPEDTSPKRPADGVQPVFFHSSGSGLTGPFSATLPANAEQVTGRLFITGHGGNSDPACGNPADEFCQRTNRILVDSEIGWEDIPWRTCSSACSQWNACGTTSCTFNRSGWCPGEIACHDDDEPLFGDPCDQDLPFTDLLTPGQAHDVEYEVVDVNGSWSRSLVLYWYDDITPVCGNNIAEDGEACDGFDLNGGTCQNQGFDTGTVSCQPDCLAFDVSQCRTYVCGNSICELGAGEDCVSCPDDCNGVQSGSPAGRFCCGDGDGEGPVDCSDPRCTGEGNTCLP